VREERRRLEVGTARKDTGVSEKPILVIGNRTYSSWSLRGWLVMALSGLAFDEEMVWLDAPDHAETMRAATSGVGMVPTLRVGARIVADSLAIAEYAAERAPEARLWPEDALDRAEARSFAARMHSGFAALRKACPMNLSNRFDGFEPDAAVGADLAALEAMWKPALARSGGPFLFGRFGAVDAFFAPVAARVFTFRLPVSAPSGRYVDALLAHPSMRAWIGAARREADIDRPRTDRLATGYFAPGDWPILDT
jgi:glutathione S-transferase